MASAKSSHISTPERNDEHTEVTSRDSTTMREQDTETEQRSRRASGRKLAAKRASIVNERKPSCWSRFPCLTKVIHCLRRVLERTGNYFKGVFSLPLVRDPISYSRCDYFNSAGIRTKKTESENDLRTLDQIEAVCNYTRETIPLIDRLVAERRENAINKNVMSTTLDFSKLPPWNDSVLDRLESIFRVFDTSGDGLVDFEELSSILNEFGDTSSPEERHRAFEAADLIGKAALNFEAFVTMIHHLTVKAPDAWPSTLVETFRQIDRNMARVRSLDVVQQLQAGLF